MTKLTIEEIRLQNKRRTENEWARKNRDRVNAYRRARKARAKPAEVVGEKVKGVYHGEWKGTTYQCPELTYRGKA